jgi:primosomal protein N'
VKKLNVFPDSCQKAVWQAVETNQCLNKDYLFRCKNFMGSYFLIDWKEQLKCWQCHQLTTAGKLCPDCARKILKDYE